MLKQAEYPTWKVKMMMYLESSDLEYVDRILQGSYIPKKLVPQANGVVEHYIKKTKSGMTPEEKTKYLNDSKVKNHSSQ